MYNEVLRWQFLTRIFLWNSTKCIWYAPLPPYRVIAVWHNPFFHISCTCWWTYIHLKIEIKRINSFSDFKIFEYMRTCNMKYSWHENISLNVQRLYNTIFHRLHCFFTIILIDILTEDTQLVYLFIEYIWYTTWFKFKVNTCKLFAI